MDTNLSIPHNGFTSMKAAGAIAQKQQTQDAKKVSETQGDQGAKLNTRSENSDKQAAIKKSVAETQEKAAQAKQETTKQADFEIQKPQIKKDVSFSPGEGVVYKETHAQIDDIVYVQIPNEQQLRAREEYAKQPPKLTAESEALSPPTENPKSDTPSSNAQL